MWIRLFIYLLISLATILIANLLTDLISFLLSFFKKSLNLEDKIKGFMRGTFWGLISSCIVAVLSVFMKTTMDSLIFFIIAIEIVLIEFFIIAEQKITTTISQLPYRYNYILGSLLGLIIGYSIL
jgi:hypothetical protein